MRKTEDPIRKLVVRRNIADWIRPAVYSAQRSVGQRRMPGAVRVPCRDSRVWPPTEHVGGSVVRGDPGDRPAKSGLRHGHQPGGRAGSPMLPEWSGVHIVRSRCAVRRASPPGDAAVDRDRRETYGAALQQFDELMAAARVVSAVSRPIPQYYSMHQAGKAITAAWAAEDWKVAGHGLAQDTSAGALWRSDVLFFRVRPRGQGVFGAVASLLGGSGLTGSVDLGALWSALPEIEPPPEGRWLRALPVYAESNLPGASGDSSPFRGYIPVQTLTVGSATALTSLLAAYPHAAGAAAEGDGTGLVIDITPEGPSASVMWPAPEIHAETEELHWAEMHKAYVSERLPWYPRTDE